MTFMSYIPYWSINIQFSWMWLYAYACTIITYIEVNRYTKLHVFLLVVLGSKIFTHRDDYTGTLPFMSFMKKADDHFYSRTFFIKLVCRTKRDTGFSILKIYISSCIRNFVIWTCFSGQYYRLDNNCSKKSNRLDWGVAVL